MVQAAFLRPPLVGRAAYATLAFLNALGGPRFVSLQARSLFRAHTQCCMCAASQT